MTLKIPGIPNLLFSGSRGVGMSRESKEITITVSLDNTGDTNSIIAAENMLPDGGKIRIKSGTYVMDNPWRPQSNITYEGTGWDTVLSFTETGNRSWIIGLEGGTGIILKDMKIYINATGNNDGDIELASSTDSILDNVWIDVVSTDNHSVFVTTGGGTVTGLIVRNCKVTANLAGGDAAHFLCENLSKCQFIDSKFEDITFQDDDGDFNNCIVKGNIMAALTIPVGSNNNVVIGNQTDVAIVDNGAGNQVANNCVF